MKLRFSIICLSASLLACGSPAGPTPSAIIIASTQTSQSSRGAAVADADAPEFLALERIEPYTAYLERRRTHRTKQRGVGPIQGARLAPAPKGAELVVYRSGAHEFPGWLLRPGERSEEPARERRPGVVYLHNDFALTTLSYRNAKPLREAGFVVFLPTLRAENGNPGDFELLLGEVDDAKAAARWLADHPLVDDRRVYVIGHSIGGAIAALLSLHPDLPAQRTASVGGIYRARTFASWARGTSTRRLIRFDPMDKSEVTMRLLGPNVRDMAHPHIAYAGRDDRRDRRYARDVARLAGRHDAPYTAVLVDGAHMSSIRPAIRHFIDIIEADASRSSH